MADVPTVRKKSRRPWRRWRRLRPPRGPALRRTTRCRAAAARRHSRGSAAGSREAERGGLSCGAPCAQAGSEAGADLPIEPCSRIRRRVPARSCSSSTFWVMTVTPSRGATAPRGEHVVRRVGTHGRDNNWRRHSYHSHTSCGSRAKASGVARSSARNCLHRPAGPAKGRHAARGRHAGAGEDRDTGVWCESPGNRIERDKGPFFHPGFTPSSAGRGRPSPAVAPDRRP